MSQSPLILHRIHRMYPQQYASEQEALILENMKRSIFIISVTYGARGSGQIKLLPMVVHPHGCRSMLWGPLQSEMECIFFSMYKDK